MDDKSAPRIFISYRRADTAHVAGRLADRLVDRDHKEKVFLDVQSILPGRDFAKAVDEAIGTCDALLALISPNWVDVTDKLGRRRLDDATDMVRSEIAAALRHEIPVIPVLVDGATHPDESDLPENLKALARLQGIGLDHSSFDADVAAIRKALPSSPSARPVIDGASTQPARRRGRRPLAVTITITVAAVIITTVVALLVQPTADPVPPRPSATAVRSTTAVPTTTAPPALELFDDFSNGLDLTGKWRLTSADGADPRALGQVYVADGKLNLDVTPQDSKAGVNATLTAVLPDRPVAELAVTMTLASQDGPSDGAAYLIVISKQGREQRIWMGPDGDQHPALGFLLCGTGLCHDKVGAQPTQYPAAKGAPYSVRVTQSAAGGVQFAVGGGPSATAPPDPGPISGFAFYLFSDTGRSFHVTVDDVRVRYA